MEFKQQVEHTVSGLLPVSAKLLFAVEGGSRAWGFASEGSDYDIRFVYSYPWKTYVSVGVENRDSVRGSYPTEFGVFDVEGWDIRKAMSLLLKSNISIVDWLMDRDPYVVLDLWSWKALKELALQYPQKRKLWASHRGLARDHFKRYVEGQLSVPVKKYLYIIKSVVWMLYLDHGLGFPDRNLLEASRQLEEESVMPSLILAIVDRLIKEKKLSSEASLQRSSDKIHTEAYELDSWAYEVLSKESVGCWDTEISKSVLEEFNEVLWGIVGGSNIATR